MHRNLSVLGNHPTTLFLICVVIFGIAAAPSMAGQPPVAFDGWDGSSNVFGGRRTEFVVLSSIQSPWQGRLGWSLAIDRRVIARGERAVDFDRRGPSHAVIAIDVPEVKQGVVLQAELSVGLFATGKAEPVDTMKWTLWIFPDDPFAGRRQWLEELHIHLFDPPGNTRRVFEQMEIPFLELGNVESAGDRNRGILVIGEGISLDEYRGLAAIMVQSATRGTDVLCLAPADGLIVLPGTEEDDLPQPGRLVLRRTDVIRELDKRLDPKGLLPGTSLVLGSDRNRLVAEVTHDDTGWAWLEATYPVKQGRLVVCSFGMIENWDAGPTPRFLFARLLEYVSTNNHPSLSRGENDDHQK